MLYLRTERYADAREQLARAVQLGRNTAHVHTALGLSRDRRCAATRPRRTTFSARSCSRPTIEPRCADCCYALTETHEHDKAEALVEQLLRDEPDDRDLWLYRAQIALAADERASALASLETALRLGDDSVENRRACFELQMESGNVARGVELLRGLRGTRAAVRARRPGARLARERERVGSLPRALGLRRSRGAQRRRAKPPADAARERSRVRDGNRRAASTALQEALELDPANADALMALGQIYRTDRDYGRAELLLRRASDYGAVRENALVARAEVAIDQENFDGALDALAQRRRQQSRACGPEAQHRFAGKPAAAAHAALTPRAPEATRSRGRPPT